MILSPHQTALFLQSRGYEVDKNFKFKIRKDERTPSASIYKDGKIHDFGTGWHGDIVDFMIHFENIPKRNAFAIAKEFSNNHFDFQCVKTLKIKMRQFSSHSVTWCLGRMQITEAARGSLA